MTSAARFDRNGQIAFSFEALLLRYRSSHRWLFFSDMNRDEVAAPQERRAPP
jgi:hypothetical protein